MIPITGALIFYSDCNNTTHTLVEYVNIDSDLRNPLSSLLQEPNYNDLKCGDLYVHFLQRESVSRLLK